MVWSLPLHPVRFVYADAGFAGQLVDWCQGILRTTLHIVRKAPGHVRGHGPLGAINGMVRRLTRGRRAARQPAWTLDDPTA